MTTTGAGSATRTRKPSARVPIDRFTLGDGTPATSWVLATRRQRLAAWVLDVVLFLGTLGVGWTIATWRRWSRGSTPGKAILGLTVFDIDTRRPCTRRRMGIRALGHQGLVLLMGLATLGAAWLYALAGFCGINRRPLWDEWARVIVLAPSSTTAGTGPT